MKEYITKAKVIEAIEKAIAPEITTIGDYETIGVFTRESIERIVSNLPAAGVAEVKHAEWKYYHKQNKAVCTNCSFERDLDTDFGRAVACPNCGALMKEDEEDEHEAD